jgi:hypothetical protein
VEPIITKGRGDLSYQLAVKWRSRMHRVVIRPDAVAADCQVSRRHSSVVNAGSVVDEKPFVWQRMEPGREQVLHLVQSL